MWKKNEINYDLCHFFPTSSYFSERVWQQLYIVKFYPFLFYHLSSPRRHFYLFMLLLKSSNPMLTHHTVHPFLSICILCFLSLSRIACDSILISYNTTCNFYFSQLDIDYINIGYNTIISKQLVVFYLRYHLSHGVEFNIILQLFLLACRNFWLQYC